MLSAARAGAEPAGALTLTDCLEYAHTHNLDVQIARTQTAMVQARVREAGARYLPSLSLDGYYQSYDTTPTQNVSVPNDLHATIAGQPKPLTFQIKDALTIQTTPRDPSDMKLSLTQPVFTSGKLTTALAVRRAEAGTARLREEEMQAQVDLAVARAFAELLLAEEGHALQEVMVRQTSAVLADVEHRFDQQAASRLELLEARSTETRAQMPLLRARQDERNRRDDLAHVLGWDADQPLAIQGRLVVVPVHADPQALVQRALAERPDLKVVGQELNVKERELLAVKLTNTPSISLVGNYEFVQRARNDLPENVLSGGVALTWPIFEGGTIVPQLQAARLALEAVALQRRQLEAAVALEVRKAVADLDVAAEAQRTQERAVATAGERLHVDEEGLRMGSTAAVEVVRAQMELLDARLAEAQLRFDHVMARTRLAYLVGAAPGEFEP